MPNIYAIGDVQGCFDSLQALVKKLPLKGKDRIWLSGDLVNRGPKSAEVLRWAIEQGEKVVVVLGNHDLHLLSAAAGERKQKPRDTFQDVLKADDSDELLEWLRQQPLVHREDDYLLVHAGVHPRWTLKQVMALAEECEAAVRNGTWHSAWKLSRPSPPRWSNKLKGDERLAAALSVLVGVRTIYEDGGLETHFTGHPEHAPEGARPWYAEGRCESTVIFGHWAALGLHVGPHHIGLDTGCVWGGQLTALRLGDRKVFHQPSIEVRRAIE